MSLNNQELHKESIKYLTTAPIRENDPRLMSALKIKQMIDRFYESRNLR